LSFLAVFTGRSAAAKVFETIDRIPDIDSANPGGLKPASVKGELVLENVTFSYPSRPTIDVVKGLSITFRAGKTAAHKFQNQNPAILILSKSLLGSSINSPAASSHPLSRTFIHERAFDNEDAGCVVIFSLVEIWWRIPHSNVILFHCSDPSENRF
jgi:hypothetical protein